MIKPASKSDFTLLAQMIRQTFVDAFGHEMDRVHLANHLTTNLSDAKLNHMFQVDEFLIAQLDERCVGFVQVGDVNLTYAAFLTDTDLEPFDLELRRAYVLAEFQNQGIGQRLIDCALARQAKVPAAHLFLDVWETNHGAQRLYEKNGFELVGKMPEVDPQGRQTGYEHLMVRRGR